MHRPRKPFTKLTTAKKHVGSDKSIVNEDGRCHVQIGQGVKLAPHANLTISYRVRRRVELPNIIHDCITSCHQIIGQVLRSLKSANA
jgi:hypothetical protein